MNPLAQAKVCREQLSWAKPFIQETCHLVLHCKPRGRAGLTCACTAGGWACMLSSSGKSQTPVEVWPEWFCTAASWSLEQQQQGWTVLACTVAKAALGSLGPAAVWASICTSTGVKSGPLKGRETAAVPSADPVPQLQGGLWSECCLPCVLPWRDVRFVWKEKKKEREGILLHCPTASGKGLN